MIKSVPFLEYLKEGNCQSITNKCKTIPSYPRPRSYHTSIVYTTYTQNEANQMCPDDYCGPYCYSRSPECQIQSIYPGYPVPKPNEGLFSFEGPVSDNCPDKCCESTNEYCYRAVNNAGNLVEPENEIMLVFGGLTTNNIQIETNQSILSNCSIPESIFKSLNTTNAELSAYYLLNNCGYEMLNEIWEYNINKNTWHYVKPFIDNVITTQQKPYPRYGHASVYIEQTERSAFDQLIVRKYMFVYGGYSLYCQHSCEDMWSYEIPYAPQRYYPDSSYSTGSTSITRLWNRGNVWSRLYPSSFSTPGPRVHHSMTVDDGYRYIYLFGGMGVDSVTGKNILYNDLWRYEIRTNIWEQLNTVGLYQITRSIVFWDGTVEKIIIPPKDREDTDQVKMTLQFKKADTEIGQFPKTRSSASLIFSKIDDKDYLILFGGYTMEGVQIYNIQSQLGDIWVYSITGNSWLEAFPNSENNPDKRYGASAISLDNEKILMYGGMNSEKVFNDLWLFNLKTNMWTKINKTNLVENEEDWPYPAKYFTLVKYSKGAVLYGGSIWRNSDLQDYDNYAYKEIISENQLFAIIDNLWILYSSLCSYDCNKHGTCDYGRCICDNGYWGKSCEYEYCPGSFCYIDLDIFTEQVCHHCSNHGECIKKKCECEAGYTGDDCSIPDCPNNCSGEEYGKCIVMRPQSQCDCNQQLKRGGDDCSIVFCLNTCGENGECNEDIGVCNCSTGYYGEDCSLYIIDFRQGAQTINIYLFNNILFFIILIVI